MKIWILQTGEPIPDLAPSERKWRCALICEHLHSQGHEVVWWTQNFDHRSKQFLYKDRHSFQSKFGYRVELLQAISYKRNISLGRYKSQKLVAEGFLNSAEEREAPDLIFCGLPTIELCHATSIYSSKHNVPYVVDVRDPWPDVYFSACPVLLKPIAKIFLSRDRKRISNAINGCSAVTAVSETYLKWAQKLGNQKRNPEDLVFPLGFESDSLKEVDKESVTEFKIKFGLPEKTTFICFIGSFGTSYDLDVILDTAQIALQKNRKDIVFLIAGDGEKATSIRNRAIHLENVFLTGWLNSSELKILKAISHAGLANYTSKATQSLPNKPFEYMAAGLPIIASLNGELAQLIDEKSIGYSYIAGDPQSLFSRCIEIADNSEQTSNLSRNALNVFEDDFSTCEIYPKLCRFLVSLASKS